MKRTPVQTACLHLISKLGLDPKRQHGTNTESNHKWLVTNVAKFMHHKAHTGHLTPRSRFGGAGGKASGTTVGTAGCPNLLLLGHLFGEGGVDFGEFGCGEKSLGCCLLLFSVCAIAIEN